MVSLLSLTLAGALLGLLFGSFLNVCIVRVPAGESLLKPGSHCRACGHALRPYDNIPLLSWLLLGGRCRDCAAPIPWRYPAVELALGAWGAITGSLLFHAWQAPGPLTAAARTVDPAIQLTILTAGFAVLGFLLLGLMVMDWQTQRLPDVFTLSGIAAGLLMVCVQAVFLGPKDNQVVLNGAKQLRLSSPGSFISRGNVFLTGPENLIYGRLLAIAAAALLLLVVRWGYRAVRRREGLGLGDVKLLAMVAAFLGFWPALLTLFLGVALASGYAAVLLARGQAGAATRLPLGSFLCAGGLFAALFGEAVIGWYRGLLG